MLDDFTNRDLIEQVCQALSTPVAVKDLNHRFIYANEAFSESIGVPSCELIGKDDLELGRSKKLVLGDPEKNWPGLWAIDEQIIALEQELGRGAVYHFQEQLNVRDQNAYIRSIRTPLKDSNGQIVALMVQRENVTEVHELKNRIADNLENLSTKTSDMTTMDSVLASFLTCRDTDTLANELAKVILERTNASSTFIWLLDETEDFLECVAASGYQASIAIGQKRAINEGIVGKVWQSGKTVVSEDVANDASAVLKWEPGVRFCSVPVIADGQVIAAIGVANGDDTALRSDKVRLLERIAGVASIAVVNARMTEETVRALSRTRALAEVSEMLVTMDNRTDAYDTICRMLVSAYNVSRATCYMLDAEGELQSHVAWGYEAGEIAPIQALGNVTGQSIVNWCAQNAQPATTKRLEDDPRESSEIHQVRRDLNIGSTSCVPLMKKNEVIGVIAVSRNRSQSDFNSAEIDGFRAMVNQLSIAVERLELSEDLQRQAFHDRLTHLPNRHHYELELRQTLENKSRLNEEVLVLFIDLDGFKLVNDTLGHAAGDQLLTIVANRFANTMRSSDVLARMGGDEFAAILRSNDSKTRDGYEVAKRLLACLDAPIDIDGEQVKVGASIGLSRFPDHGSTADALLVNADVAMYKAKKAGKGCICQFDQELSKTVSESVRLKNDLRKAVDQGEFCLVYQPQIDCDKNRVVGVEALIRWNNPARGMMLPKEFIPVAEETGLIYRIGNWVINEAVRQLAEWQKTPMRGIRLCVNVEASQFKSESFADDVLSALENYKAPGNLLEIEVTESVVIHNVDSVANHLLKLRENGVRISIDDFGTGYSSLSYLRELPLDALKIDRTFVKRLGDDACDQSFLNTILMLASSLGLETVAEGVELPEQQEAVKQMGCDLIQGYLYSRPVPSDELYDVIDSIQNQLLADNPARRSA